MSLCIIRVQSYFQSVQEQRGGEQIAAAARAEASSDEGSVHGAGSFDPPWPTNAACSEERACGGSRVGEAGHATAMQKVGIIRDQEQGEERLHAGRQGIARRKTPAALQRWQADLQGEPEAAGGLRARASRAEPAQRVRAVAADRDRSCENRAAPALANDGAQHASRT